MMTLKDDCVNYGSLVVRWLFGLALAGLGAYMIVQKIAVWPGIGVLTFGVFILRPKDLQSFSQWFRENAASYLSKSGDAP